MRVIGGELDVATIMEGSVQRAGNRVRINVQLIDADTDEHLWAEVYDRELTVANIFEIQTEMATAIANALRANLTSDEQQRLALKPTENQPISNGPLTSTRSSHWPMSAFPTRSSCRSITAAGHPQL
jgi:hypothetical protein